MPNGDVRITLLNNASADHVVLDGELTHTLFCQFLRLPGYDRRTLAQRSACADRTAAALFSCTTADDRFPRMAVFTQPPYPPAAAGRYLLRREAAVKGRMPLRCDHRLLGLQIIKSRQDLAVGAVRAIALPVHTVGDDRTEGMPLVTEPPHAAIGIYAHRLRRQRAVLFPVPLDRKLRMQRSEIIESGQDLLPRAERTACV